MKLVSFGDRIVPGTYRIHSIFSKAVNFIDPEDSSLFSVSVVSPDIGGGPINVVLEDFFEIDFSREDEIQVYADHFIFKNKKVFFKDKIYRSKMELAAPSKRALRTFQRSLLKTSRSKSLGFLLDEKKEKDFINSFEKAFVKQMKQGVMTAFSSEFEHGIEDVRGTGTGLTPSGDDFLAGLIMSFHLEKNHDLIDKVFTRAVSSSPFSNTGIYYAREGAYFEPMKKLIEALLYKNEEIDKWTEKLAGIGGTSGVDQESDFSWGLRDRFNKE